MLDIIIDINFIVVGIPLLISMHMWWKRINAEISKSGAVTDDIKQKALTCKIVSASIIVLIIFGCIDLIGRA